MILRMSGLMDHGRKLSVTAGTNLGVQLLLGNCYVARWILWQRKASGYSGLYEDTGVLQARFWDYWDMYASGMKTKCFRRRGSVRE